MAAGELHPAPIPMKPTIKYTQAGASWQSLSLKSTAGSRLAGSHNPPQKQDSLKPKCIYCSQGQWSDECTKFATVQAHKEKVRNSCFKCLQKEHVLKGCRRNRQCAHCGTLNHHRSLWSKLFNNGPQSSSVPPEKVNTEAQTVSGVVDEENIMLTLTNQVLMQRATALIKNIPDCISLTICVIIRYVST